MEPLDDAKFSGTKDVDERLKEKFPKDMISKEQILLWS